MNYDNNFIFNNLLENGRIDIDDINIIVSDENISNSKNFSISDCCKLELNYKGIEEFLKNFKGDYFYNQTIVFVTRRMDNDNLITQLNKILSDNLRKKINEYSIELQVINAMF